MFKMGDDFVEKSLHIISNECLQEGKVQEALKNSEVFQFFKKGDYFKLKNYRTINLPPTSTIYQLNLSLID